MPLFTYHNGPIMHLLTFSNKKPMIGVHTVTSWTGTYKLAVKVFMPHTGHFKFSRSIWYLPIQRGHTFFRSLCYSCSQLEIFMLEAIMLLIH